MNQRVKTVIIFFSGILFGMGIAIGIGFYKIHKDSGRPLVGPKVFGDIRIYQEPLNSKDGSVSNRCRSLILERNGIELVQVNQSEPGISKELFVGNNKHLPIVHIKFTKDDEDYILRYGHISPRHKDIYQKYIDFDMDGQLDYMISFDNKGQVSKETAYSKKTQEWVSVSESDASKQIIKINDNNYKFCDHEWKDIDSQNRLSEPNKVDPNERMS